MSLYHGLDDGICKQAIYEILCSPHPPNFVFITAERLATSQWKNLMELVYNNKRFGLMVFDEAQVILEVRISNLWNIKCVQSQIVIVGRQL